MEFVTALRSTLDDQKPSLFEILSEQQLNSLLPLTLRHLLAVATQRYPRYLLRALNSFDELYALLMLLVERYYLRTRGGGFTEHFYGLKRERALQSEIPRATATAQGLVRDTLKLSERDVWKNLAVMVAVPYVKCRLDLAHEIEAPRAMLGANYTRMPANPTLRQRLMHYYKWFLRNVYPSVHAAYYFSIIAFNLAYLIVGAVVVEAVFAYPGIGRLLVDSVSSLNMPVVQACVLIFAGVYIVLNLSAELLGVVTNPRLLHPK